VSTDLGHEFTEETSEACAAPKTPAFWDIVNASYAPEDAELADVLDKMGNPDAVTLVQLIVTATGGTAEWLMDRRNRRAIPHRLERCGYVSVRNSDSDDGLWRIQDKRQAVYAKTTLSEVDRYRAAQDLKRETGG
jgi:hypothetical protein